MGGVYHDVRAELAANGACRGFCGIGRAEHFAYLVYGFFTFVDQHHALAFSRFFAVFDRAGIGADSGHETDDLVKLLAGKG